MARIESPLIQFGDANKEKVANAHTASMVDEYGDRRGSLSTARWQKAFGFVGLTLGVTAMLAAAALTPFIAAPTTLGIIGASGATTAEVGGGTMLVGWLRDLHNRRHLKKIPERG